MSNGTNVYGARGGEFEGIRSVYGVKSGKIVFFGRSSYSLVETLLLQHVSLSHKHSVTDRQQ